MPLWLSINLTPYIQLCWKHVFTSSLLLTIQKKLRSNSIFRTNATCQQSQRNIVAIPPTNPSGVVRSIPWHQEIPSVTSRFFSIIEHNLCLSFQHNNYAILFVEHLPKNKLFWDKLANSVLHTFCLPFVFEETLPKNYNQSSIFGKKRANLATSSLQKMRHKLSERTLFLVCGQRDWDANLNFLLFGDSILTPKIEPSKKQIWSSTLFFLLSPIYNKQRSHQTWGDDESASSSKTSQRFNNRWRMRYNSKLNHFHYLSDPLFLAFALKRPFVAHPLPKIQSYCCFFNVPKIESLRIVVYFSFLFSHYY